MRRIGLIGGMSWESTAVYYRRLNERTRELLGGLESADIVMRSVNFAEVVDLQKTGQWDKAGSLLSSIARDLARSGAEIILICTNTMHRLADVVQDSIDIPLLHIADVTASRVLEAGCLRPLLLATRYTMEEAFYRDRVAERYNLDLLVPESDDRQTIHGIIFDELCRGIIRPESRAAYVEAIDRGKRAGADGVILGCTEIGMLIGEDDVELPLFDSTKLHADAALDFALAPRHPIVTAVYQAEPVAL